ncbi:MAG: hypothetical protein HC809_10970, partial [Gammaproteobacteria bacterium]|nr:hypothetical protein [Gammaproteobacteria bacterium]
MAIASFDDLRGGDGPTWIFYSTGGVFSALVLVPHLASVQGALALRAIALVLYGVATYWSAVRLAIWATATGAISEWMSLTV